MLWLSTSLKTTRKYTLSPSLHQQILHLPGCIMVSGQLTVSLPKPGYRRYLLTNLEFKEPEICERCNKKCRKLAKQKSGEWVSKHSLYDKGPKRCDSFAEGSKSDPVLSFPYSWPFLAPSHLQLLRPGSYYWSMKDY